MDSVARSGRPNPSNRTRSPCSTTRRAVATLASAGAGLVRGLLAADARRDGRLVELCTIAIPTHYNLHAIWPRERHARVKPLVDAIGTLVAQSLAC